MPEGREDIEVIMTKHPFASLFSRTGKKSLFFSAYLWIPLLAALITLIVELFNHKTFTNGPDLLLTFFADYPLAFVVNFLLILVTLVPAFFLRRRLFYLTLVSAVWLIGGGVNGFILLNRLTPFTTADLTVFNTGLETLPNYMSTDYIILLAVALVVLLAVLVFLFLKGPKSRESLLRRLITGAAALAISAGLLTGVGLLAFSQGQISRVFANLAFAYQDYGFPYCFLQTWLNTGIRRPSGYNATDMTRIRQEIQDDTKQTTAQTDVNVIYVQLESFMDPSEFKGVELSEDAVPNWHAMEEKYTTGYLTVPVVGAGTANTECEVLTGMSTRFFGPGEYPYKTSLTDHTAESVAYDLAALGYGTHAIHNHRATFYSRNIVFKNLGFDDFTSLEYMPRVARTPRNWAKDYVLTDQIIGALDSTEGKPDLVFTVSVQGHGSYPTEPVLTNPPITVKSCPDNTNQYAVEYYVNEIHEMDEFLGELTDALSQRKEKTVLVLYGDHLPSLGLTRTDLKSGSLYKTKYIIWNNFGMKKEDKNLCAYQLSASVLKKLGITEGLMDDFQQNCQKEPTYLTDLKKLQYDALYGSHYLYGGIPFYQPTDMKMGYAPITVTGIYQRGDTWYVQGTHFSPYCRVTVDGKMLDTVYLSTTLLRLDKNPGVKTPDQIQISVVDMHEQVLSEDDD